MVRRATFSLIPIALFTRNWSVLSTIKMTTNATPNQLPNALLPPHPLLFTTPPQAMLPPIPPHLTLLILFLIAPPPHPTPALSPTLFHKFSLTLTRHECVRTSQNHPAPVDHKPSCHPSPQALLYNILSHPYSPLSSPRFHLSFTFHPHPSQPPISPTLHKPLPHRNHPPPSPIHPLDHHPTPQPASNPS